MLVIPAPDFYGGKPFSQKIAGATIWIIINLEIHLKGMAAQEDTFLDSPIEPFNLRDMSILVSAIEGDDKIIHLCL